MIANDEQKIKRWSSRQYSDQLIDSYRRISINNQITSSMVKDAFGVSAGRAAQILWLLCKDGHLKKIGHVGNPANTPSIYEWVIK